MKGEFRIYRRNLPHWRLGGHAYFVTWRLDKSQGPMSSVERSLVFDAVKFFDGDRYIVLAQVVMDDHVHVMLVPEPGHELETIVHSWKSFTANGLLKKHGRHGKIWQKEYFDRIIRNEKEYNEKMMYVLTNPAMRWPDLMDYEWVWVCP